MNQAQMKDSEKKIDSCGAFLALVTKNFKFDDILLYQWNYARNKRIPFIILKEEGITIPKEMLKDVKVIKEIPFNKNNFHEQIKDIVKVIKKGYGVKN